MSYEIYCRLIDELCKQFNITDMKPEYEICKLQFNDTDFILRHGGQIDPEGLYVFCDFGEPPPAQTELVLQRLLAVNLFMYGDSTPNYGINSVTGHVMFMFRLPMPRVNLAVLLAMMAQTTVQMRAWRKTFLLDASEPLPSIPLSDDERPVSADMQEEIRRARDPAIAHAPASDIQSALAEMEQEGFFMPNREKTK